MTQSQDHMTRKEFIKRVATIILPSILAVAAIWIGFSVYELANSPVGSYKLLLLVVLLLIFAYPALKRRYGQSVWNRLPSSIQRIALAIRIVGLFLAICFLLLLGLSMPILLVLACIQLMIENYRLRNELEAVND